MRQRFDFIVPAVILTEGKLNIVGLRFSQLELQDLKSQNVVIDHNVIKPNVMRLITS